MLRYRWYYGAYNRGYLSLLERASLCKAEQAFPMKGDTLKARSLNSCLGLGPLGFRVWGQGLGFRILELQGSGFRGLGVLALYR